MPDTEEPPIRPLPGEEPGAPAPAPGAGWGSWLAVAAGAVGLAVGLLVGLGIGADPDVPPTTGGTLSSLPPDLAAPGFVEATTTTTTTTTVPPPTTTTTTRADPAPPPTLGEMVPGLDGTVLFAQLQVDQLLRWRVSASAPERFALPPGTSEVHFDASADWIGALQTVPDSVRPGETLYLAGRDMDFQPFDTGVTTFDWHPTAPRRLAWVRTTFDGELELWSGEVPGPAEDLRRVAGFGSVAEDEQLVLRAWGDWGYALTRFRLGAEQVVLTLDPDGRTVGEREAAFVAAAPDGRLLVKPLPPGADPRLGAGFTDLAMETFEPVAWPISLEAIWSSGGERLASVSFEGVGAVLRVRGDGSFQHVLDAQWAIPVAWSPGNRFVVSYADGVRTRFSIDPEDSARDGEQRRPALVFTDAADRSTSAIAVTSPVTEMAFRVAS